MEMRWSCPSVRLTTCGQMMPTKPMTPRKETATAVRSDEIRSEKKRSRSTWIPIAAADASPERSALYRQLMSRKKMKPARVTMSRIRSVLYVARPRSPNVQTTAAEMPTSVAKNCKIVVPAVQMKPIAMPARTTALG